MRLAPTARRAERLLVFLADLVAAVGSPVFHQLRHVGRRAAGPADVVQAVVHRLIEHGALVGVGLGVEADRRIEDAAA